MQTTGIRLENISFAYGSRTVLASISLEIPKGQIWGLVGRSGTGKTTLLQIIAGLYKPTSGSIVVNGRLAESGRIKGIVFQDECLLGWLTVEQNLLFPNHRKPKLEEKDTAKRILHAVGLEDWGAAYPYELSSGMQKRVEFARALVADQEYILADEPFGPVDAITRRALWSLWLDLRKTEPRTGILCTHDPEEAIRLCDAVVTLQGGLPSICAFKLCLPKTIRSLGITEENEALWSLKQQIIASL